MAEVAWTASAVQDLRQIYQFISRDSERYAGLTVERIRGVVGRLATFPLSGRMVPELPAGTYREVIVGRYRAIYRYQTEADLVLVLAVVHGSRTLPLV